MNRKATLTKVREKVLATLPLLPDADLAHIAAMCNGLLRLRAQQKATALKPHIVIQENLHG